jgi:polar amino acid transport system substrate-binding protein
MLECLANGGCDIASLGFDPARADQVGGFSPPFMQVDYTYLVPAGSTLRDVAEVDRPDIRIAAVRDHASTLALARVIRNAMPIFADTPDAAFDLLRGGQTDAWATIVPTALSYAGRLPGSRVLAGSYGANWPALVVAKGQGERLAYVCEFVEFAKRSGVIQVAIERAGQLGYRAAVQENAQ